MGTEEDLFGKPKHNTKGAFVWNNVSKRFFGSYLTIRPVARKGYGSIAHEAKPNGLLIRGS